MEVKTNYMQLSDEEIIKLYEQYIPEGLQHGFYKSKGFMFTKLFQDLEESIEQFEVFDSDIWITSFPKSGTTWLSEMVWAICNNLNTPEAKAPLDTRVRFLEYSSLYTFKDPIVEAVNNSLKKVEEMPHPRLIKTHLPWQFLPAQIRNFSKRPRIIHIARNPKDSAVSYYHHSKLFRGYSGPPELFYEIFIRGLLRWCPYFDNVHSYWEKKDEPNVLFLKFEEMKSDMCLVIKKIAKFLNVELNQEKLDSLLVHLTFDNMKKNEDLNVDNIVEYIKDKFNLAQNNGSFLRKGEAGAYKNEMSAEYQDRFDKWMKDNSKFDLFK